MGWSDRFRAQYRREKGMNVQEPLVNVSTLRTAQPADKDKGDLAPTQPPAGDAPEQVVAFQAELDAMRATLGEREAQLASVQATLAQAEQAHFELAHQAAEGYRRALIAENSPGIVPELVQGATVEALEASVAAARAAYDRALDTARTELEAKAGPMGAFSRLDGVPDDKRTPLEKIANGLRNSTPRPR